MIDYQDMGRRIRKFRQARHLSQDKLAELANLSTPHMSHIETGATKVSLPTLIRIANSLDCTLDELLCDSLPNTRGIYENELTVLMRDCTDQEVKIITDVVSALKCSLRKR